MKFTWYSLAVAEERGRQLLDADDFCDASVAMLDLSGTGIESAVFEQVNAYLTMVLAGRKLGVMSEYACAAELASNADFTDYGVSLRTAWVTDVGRSWMADYQAWLASDEGEK